MPAKFKSCVKKVELKSEGKYNPYAVCRKSTGFTGSTKHKYKHQHKRKKYVL